MPLAAGSKVPCCVSGHRGPVGAASSSSLGHCKNQLGSYNTEASTLFRSSKAVLDRRRRVRCSAEEPPPLPPPGRNPASRQRLRRLGFGEKGEEKKKQKGDDEIKGPASLPQIRFPQWIRDQNGSTESAQRSKPASPGHTSKSKIPGLIGLRGNPEEVAERAVNEAVAGDETETWEDWGHRLDEADWEDYNQRHTISYHERRRQAWEGRREGTPRDSFLRPMVDLEGAKARLGFNTQKATMELEEEFDENRWESQEAIKYAGILFGVPLVIGFTVSRLLADPFFELVLAYNPNAFALSDMEKVEGAKEVHIHEMRLRMDAAIGRAPPIAENELQIELRREARHVEKELKEHNRRSLLNLLSDGTTATLIFGTLLRKTEGRDHFFRTLSRFASGLSDTAKAFLIIASTDILLGYHSEEGWTAALRMLSAHYGVESEDEPIYIFVAIVPVVMDAFFKFWIFKGLNRQNPAAAATLRSMDRH